MVNTKIYLHRYAYININEDVEWVRVFCWVDPLSSRVVASGLFTMKAVVRSKRRQPVPLPPSVAAQEARIRDISAV